MKREKLRITAGMSANTMKELSENENTDTGTLVKTCSALGCDISDVTEITEGR